jgi:ankyrin repeat protein
MDFVDNVPAVAVQDDLICSVTAGDLEAMKNILQEGEELSTTDDSGRSLIAIAAMNGHAQIVQELINRGVSLEDLDNNDMTPLMAAISSEKSTLESINLLLLNGADVQAMYEEEGVDAILFASRLGRADIVPALISAGADVESRDDNYGLTPLMVAIQEGHVHVANELIRGAANVDATLDDGTTALMEASREGRKEMVELLLAAGATVDAVRQNGTTALFIAASHDQEDIVRVLIEQGNASIEVKETETDFTPLLSASRYGHVNAVNVLLDMGANVEACDPKEGMTCVLWAASEGHEETVVSLTVKGKANILQRTPRRASALMLAVSFGLEEATKVLSENGAVMTFRDLEMMAMTIDDIKSPKIREIVQQGCNSPPVSTNIDTTVTI